ncbi:MAG: hypothetical protein K2Y56_16530 [Methylobacterium sp.]|uniref:hypothetical protein n=1 Tax=Methylobacterium sp. TaxID=409 RepID=UPI0025CFA8E6|nr:hypothetical protein [Methylobacterium sp.]MBX9933117.1 hypothetical protein [Methylobacterium sp.]
MNKFVLAVLALPLATSALAQGTVAPSDTRPPPGTVVQPGGAANSGPGSIGVVAPGATGSETRSNNPGVGGNAEQNQKPVGNTGGGGASGSAGGG